MKRNFEPYLHQGQNGDLAPAGKLSKWGRTVARTRHCDCCPRTNLDEHNQRRLAAAWNATRHLSLAQLEASVRNVPAFGDGLEILHARRKDRTKKKPRPAAGAREGEKR